MSAREIRAAGLHDPRLREAYATCNAFLRRRNSAAYPMARLLLPPERRPYWDAILAFTTHVDDLLDDPRRPVPERRTHFDAYARAFFAFLDGDDPLAGSDDPARHYALAFAHFARTWDIPRGSVQLFMDTMASDLEVTEYPSFAHLERYLHGVCGQGARWGNTLLGGAAGPGEECHAQAVAAGFGLQLTDYLRDLGEDIEDGRLYLPLADLEAFGLARRDLEEAARSRRMTAPMRELVRFEAERASRYFARAADWWRVVDAGARELPRQYVRLGRYSLRQITRSRHDLFRTAPAARLACVAASCTSFALGYTSAATRRRTP